ncbi:MAG TPA: hypothetical protein VH593_22950 [Ktedonobacteraceae bacterium]
MSRHIVLPSTHVIPSKQLQWAGATLLLILLSTMTALIYIERNPMNSLSPTQDALATIKNSGSTNTVGWTLTINKDGSGAITYDQAREHGFSHHTNKTFMAGTFASKQLETLLTQIGDVSTIPNHNCLKPASFGSTTTITYQGKTSGDLTCLTQQDASQFLALKQLVQNFPIHSN